MPTGRAEEWKQEGKEEGLREGIRKGEADLLIQLLEHKFGPMNQEGRQRIDAAGSSVLRHWTLKTLDSESLEQVFNGARPSNGEGLRG